MSDVTEKGPAYGLAAARVLVSNGSTIDKIELFYPRGAQIDPQIQTLNFEGGDTSQQVDLLSRVEIALTCDKLDLDAEQTIFNREKITAPSEDEEWGMWGGTEEEEAGVSVGLELDFRMKDESDSPHVAAAMRYTFPYGTLKQKRIQPLEYQGKHVSLLNFSFERTTVDVLGDTISGIPSGGAVYRIGRLT